MDMRETLVNWQVKDLCKNFDAYLAEFMHSPMNSQEYVSCHKETIDLGKDLGGAAKSIDSDEYMCALYSTLEAWGMNKGKNSKYGPKMREYDKFVYQVRKHKADIVALELEGKGVAQIDADITRKLWWIIEGMELSCRDTQIVTGSKALHHLLPRLLPPIDLTYTGKFFHYYTSELRREKAFNLILRHFAQITREVKQKVDLAWYVRSEQLDWATSESKMIDNAIIGYCLKHREMPRGINKAYDWWMQRLR